MCLSANLKLNAWFRSIHLCVTSSSACVSFVPSIHCLKTAFSWRVHIVKKRSSASCGSTYTKSAKTSDSQPVSCHTNSDTMPRPGLCPEIKTKEARRLAEHGANRCHSGQDAA